MKGNQSCLMSTFGKVFSNYYCAQVKPSGGGAMVINGRAVELHFNLE